MKYIPAGQGGERPTKRLLSVGGAVALLLLVGLLVGAGMAFADTTYRVQPGDTLISIAARYGTTVDAIVVANNLPNRSMIYVGQNLTIPTSGTKPPASSPPNNGQGGKYVVQSGDSF